MTSKKNKEQTGIDFLFIGGGEEQEELAKEFRKNGYTTGSISNERCSDFEDSLRRCNGALARSVVAVREIQEHSDPIKFDESFRKVLATQNITLESIYEDTPYSEEIKRLTLEVRTKLENQVDDYVGLKRLIQQTVSAGNKFEWDIEKVLGISRIIGEAVGSFRETYSGFCTNLLSVEVIKEFAGRELSEAEKLDDKGDELNQQRRYEEALPFFDKALKLSPRFCLAYINKGIALKNLGRIDEAIACYDHVINVIDPKYKKAWGNKANVSIAVGDLDSARVCVDKALEIDPNYQYAQMLRMRLG